MSWAETKLAINSTIGEENFRPFDKILTDDFVLQSADTPILFLITEQKYYPEEETISFSAMMNGTLRLKFTGVVRISIESDPWEYVTISDGEWTTKLLISIGGIEYIDTRYVDFVIEKGKSYEITLPQYALVQEMALCGARVIGNLIEIVEEA